MGERYYVYVGPASILRRVAGMPPGAPLTSPDDAIAWLAERGERETVVTYTVGASRDLRIADRRSEHVACAGFGAVTAAGELTLQRTGDSVCVTHITNQSTGYCPEPSCWDAVDRALFAVRIAHPPSFSVAYTFRRCPACDAIHLVKEEDFTCACGAELPEHWNFDSPRGPSLR